MPPMLVLVGAPGAGKSAVGRAVADRWGVGFIDTDDEVERAADATITEIFVDEGEAGFRRREREAVAGSLAECDGVLAVGGGAIEDPLTRSDLAGLFVVWLQVGAAESAKRTGISGPRPVQLGNVRTSLSAQLRGREPMYAEVADHQVATDHRTVAQIADEVAGIVAGGRHG